MSAFPSVTKINRHRVGRGRGLCHILQWVGEARMAGSPHWARCLAFGLITLISLALVTVPWRELRAITEYLPHADAFT